MVEKCRRAVIPGTAMPAGLHDGADMLAKLAPGPLAQRLVVAPFLVECGQRQGCQALDRPLLGRREWSAKIPFGPYLAMGALIWMFVGTRCLDWYAGLLAP